MFESYITFITPVAISSLQSRFLATIMEFQRSGDVNFVFSNDGSTIQDLEKYTDDKERPVNVVKVKSFKDVYEELLILT